MNRKDQIKYGELAGEIVGKVLVFGFMAVVAYGIIRSLSGH